MSDHDLILIGAIAGAIISTLAFSMEIRRLTRNAYNHGYLTALDEVIINLEKMINKRTKGEKDNEI